MPESAQKILKELTDVGLLSHDEVTKYDNDAASGSEKLMERLVTDGIVTEYQAQKFLNGTSSDISFGDYLVIKELGRGGMGTVLLARHRRMDREVAIKILPTTTLGSDDSVARFYQEVKVAAKLKHPNIVHAYDAGDHRGFHYLVMELVPGHDLSHVLQQLGPIPAAMAVDYIMQAAHGLEYAHSKGVVHRDIKPSNLLLDDEGTVKILDMGLARIGGNGEASMQLTTTGQVMGTVEYMSPEQAEDTREADQRSDIYSLGCTLFRLVTGKSPFARDTVVKTILAHRESEIPDMEPISDPSIERLNPIFKKMVAKQPEDRFQNVSELLAALRQTDGEVSYAAYEPEIISPPSHSQPPLSAPPSLDAPTMPPGQAASASSVRSNSASSNSASEQHYIGDSNYPPDVVPPTMSHSGPVVPGSSPSVPPLYGQLEPRYAVPMKHHRGRLFITLGIISLLTVWCVGAVLGIIVWIYAKSDLDEMDRNLRDSSGRTMTRTAKILGQIAAVIGGLTVLFSLIIPSL